jgi:hypothetical protein
MNSIGYPCASCQAMRAASSALASFLLPMKLSSTTKMLPTSRAWIASTSARTWATDLVRGRRPYVTMMSQNSQLNGHPRANWIATLRYRSALRRSKRGRGESSMLGLSSWRYAACQAPAS